VVRGRSGEAANYPVRLGPRPRCDNGSVTPLASNPAILCDTSISLKTRLIHSVKTFDGQAPRPSLILEIVCQNSNLVVVQRNIVCTARTLSVQRFLPARVFAVLLQREIALVGSPLGAFAK